MQVRNTFVEFGYAPQTPVNVPISAPAKLAGRLTEPSALLAPMPEYQAVTVPATSWADISDTPAHLGQPVAVGINNGVTIRQQGPPAQISLSSMLGVTSQTTVTAMPPPPNFAPQLPEEFLIPTAAPNIPPPPMMSPAFNAGPTLAPGIPPPPSQAPSGLPPQQQPLQQGSVIEVRQVATSAAMPRFAPPSFTITSMPTPKGFIPPPPMKTPVCATPSVIQGSMVNGNRLLHPVTMSPSMESVTPSVMWPPTPGNF